MSRRNEVDIDDVDEGATWKSLSDGPVRSSNGNVKVSSSFAGVSLNKATGRWRVYLSCPGAKNFDSTFENVIEAAEHYDSLVIFAILFLGICIITYIKICRCAFTVLQPNHSTFQQKKKG